MSPAPKGGGSSPGLRLRVGVTGHRPNKLPSDAADPLRATILDLIGTIESAAHAVGRPAGDTSPPRFVLVSSLAEGTDRIAAWAALEAGWLLECPLPFAPADYEADFADDASRQEFRELLARAEAVFVLDGHRAPASELAAGRPYEAAGLVMQQASDLVIAVWDGHGAAGLGGTALVVERALADQMPVIAIDPAAPDAARLMWSGFTRLAPEAQRSEDLFATGPEAREALPGVVKALVALPQATQTAHLRDFLAEPEIRWRAWAWYPLLLAVFAVKSPALSDIRMPGTVQSDVRDLASHWPFGSTDPGLAKAMETHLLEAFVRADRLAVYYAGVYRSAFVFNYVAAAVAVALALAGLVAEESKTVLVTVELVVIGSIVWNTARGWRRGWHRRWMDYRRLAETLRHMRFSILAGSSGRLRRPAGPSREHRMDWVEWYARRILRQLPLPNATTNTEYLATLSRHVVQDEIAPQVAYHQSNWSRMTAISERLHIAGLACFSLTIAACMSFGLVKAWDAATGGHLASDAFKLGVTIATAFLPTLGASLNAIRVQGDFHKAAERSLDTLRHLKAIAAAMERERDEEKATLALLADRIDKAGLAMMADLEEWQLLTETRPLSLPA